MGRSAERDETELEWPVNKGRARLGGHCDDAIALGAGFRRRNAPVIESGVAGARHVLDVTALHFSVLNTGPPIRKNGVDSADQNAQGMVYNSTGDDRLLRIVESLREEAAKITAERDLHSEDSRWHLLSLRIQALEDAAESLDGLVDHLN